MPVYFNHKLVLQLVFLKIRLHKVTHHKYSFNIPLSPQFSITHCLPGGLREAERWDLYILCSKCECESLSGRVVTP